MTGRSPFSPFVLHAPRHNIRYHLAAIGWLVRA
jgi:hypothetical protein